MQHDEVIPILDFGAQYAQLIARRVRERGVYSELVRPDISLDELKKLLPPTEVEYIEKQPSLEDVFLALVGDTGKESR